MSEPSFLGDDGQVLRDAGADLAVLSVHTSWRLAAEDVIARLAAAAVEFTADDVLAQVGPPPGHGNAVGGLFLAAARRGSIHAVGYRPSTRPSSHARTVRVWVGAR